ncbi:MAG: DUF4312 family protein [Ewingella americana]|jgi:uncharacterized protein (TIGR03578 family)|uniref:DUF4312 family protein n=2 Tax=Ewingella americana TaxID=41202 RepID=A0A2N0MW62_9GAMM|nr:DUF4312 family protein [Ewingella americana]KAA8728230.1 DUF4312 family protein [Ewingella americana]KFC85587.1 putative cytoplasmic protein [Ewingella americana ATCC 33852]MCI1677988.1 DUF4312 family protein [Ewingella americana]MCI1855876.1 DUF4312 family protein [Ewingella americana]MCI1863362.1 DUF4312 family protein [Ewingella americana]
MKQQLTTTVRVEGKGENKAAAFSAALSQVQRTVLKSTNNILLRIEPQDVKVITAEETVRKEKFLFFFLARERKSYYLVLDITVNMTVIETDKVVFVTK